MAKLKINPWKEVWLHPRNTIKAILKYDPKYMVLPLAALAGIANNALDFESMDAIVGGSSFIGSAFVAALLGIVSLYISGFLLSLTGRWINGKANALKLRAAIAWAGVPVVASLLLFIPLFFALNSEALGLLGVSSIAFLILGVWSLVLQVGMISEIQKFSIFEAILNIILAGIVILIPLLIIAVLAGTAIYA
ncbi:MAG: YIP1 family protein [Candidatus Nanoarchaeia archaeon]|jgi:hypothetical protein|nr:YIP1 family protein [Candidatus Nanoarchaeia archaeon]|tara:strand:- start:921 stop:1499 length:579 start_codon:yes stop_codon:yes gene_type:complete